MHFYYPSSNLAPFIPKIHLTQSVSSIISFIPYVFTCRRQVILYIDDPRRGSRKHFEYVELPECFTCGIEFKSVLMKRVTFVGRWLLCFWHNWIIRWTELFYVHVFIERRQIRECRVQILRWNQTLLFTIFNNENKLLGKTATSFHSTFCFRVLANRYNQFVTVRYVSDETLLWSPFYFDGNVDSFLYYKTVYFIMFLKFELTKTRMGTSNRFVFSNSTSKIICLLPDTKQWEKKTTIK